MTFSVNSSRGRSFWPPRPDISSLAVVRTVEVSFVGQKEWGVLDHDVVLPNGSVVHNPLRVLRNDRGSEIVFSLFHRPPMSDDEFREDAVLVREDLARLAALVDGR